MKNYFAFLLLVAAVACKQNEQQRKETDEEPLAIALAMRPLAFGDIKPEGWLLNEIQRNLTGFTGHLDSLAPDLILKDDIYGKDKLSKQVKHKEVGAISDAGEWQAQFLWWNSETQSNWLDGLVRSAILANDPQMVSKAETIIRHRLGTQEADGYIGIYNKDLRYHFEDENGELWSKATLYRALLAWYEYSKDKAVLDAIIKATDNVIQHYPTNDSHPFYSKNPFSGGLTHGLVFTDVLERLYFISGQKKYMDYCAFLYKDFSEQELNEDAQLNKLMDTSLALKAHGVHTYEHLRPLAAAYYATGNAGYKKAMENFLKKIESTTTPSGGLAGDEFIGGRKGDANETGYEFCSLHEGMASWISLLEKTGQPSYSAKAEKIFFNAAMGATHPSESSICYLKTDNAFMLTGGKHGDTSDKHQTRYRYSPVHKEAAVCCVPNAGRIIPYYVQSMWMKDEEGLVATLLGPCRVSSEMGGIQVTIREETNYPFEDNIHFAIETDAADEITIKVIKPVWAKSVKASISYEDKDGYLIFRKKWNTDDGFDLSFERALTVLPAMGGEVYFEYGPLVLCSQIQGVQTVTKNYMIEGFKESIYKPLETKNLIYKSAAITKAKNKETMNPPVFSTQMYNPKSGSIVPVNLVPMYHTILRQVTFPIKE